MSVNKNKLVEELDKAIWQEGSREEIVKAAAQVALKWIEEAFDAGNFYTCNNRTLTTHEEDKQTWLRENGLISEDQNNILSSSASVSEIPSKTLSTDAQEPNNISGIIDSNGPSNPPNEVKI